MSIKYLGESLDIHTGGVDHIPVHHENEIAQSEAATGVQFAKYWVHFNFLTVGGTKMSKSLNNFYTLEDIKRKGIEPAALRLLFLQTHYRAVMNFTWEAAQAAQTAFNKLKEQIRALRRQTERTALSPEKLAQVDAYRQRFVEAISNDLQMPQAMSVMWEVVKSNIPSLDKLDLLYEFDTVLGFGLNTISDTEIPQEIQLLATKRQQAREGGDFTTSDELRMKAESMGYLIEDTPDGFNIKKK
jgi:cysteinyl-tRNA synthetase